MGPPCSDQDRNIFLRNLHGFHWRARRKACEADIIFSPKKHGWSIDTAKKRTASLHLAGWATKRQLIFGAWVLDATPKLFDKSVLGVTNLDYLEKG